MPNRRSREVHHPREAVTVSRVSQARKYLSAKTPVCNKIVALRVSHR
ncbi:hypothetical protein SAMN04488107_3631 [Geodermatophilus saharensis]|uniref:Uncharacterized protein n=1 Tax=Geodermatophilus saharensis TaxID=1137994 RepID=A0A239H0R6_9ACTN|nr:hypothetical protein SAMN04488107_3631 [Geodermatophilus saharensis]